MAGKISTQVELQVPLNRAWAAFNDALLIPKALPSFVESVEVIQGDGVSAGSIRKLNFGPAVQHAKYLKEKIESVDDVTHTLVVVVVEGGSIDIHFSSTKATFKFSAAADSTIVEWAFEYEAIVADPPVQKAKEGAVRTLKAVEAYLTSNSHLYA